MLKEIEYLYCNRSFFLNTFLNKNILEILKALPASDLVKLEREAKVKVLAEQGPRLNVKDAREAVNKGLLPKDTNLQSGPKVSSKLPTTLEQAKEFFTQKRQSKYYHCNFNYQRRGKIFCLL